jgi:hypothetical protein
MSDAAIAAIMSSTVGLVGSLVAGLSVYLNYRGRHNQFRQVAYGRQMDAYFDIAGVMADLYTAAQNVLAFTNPRLPADDARRQFRTALRAEHERFTGTVNRSLIVLPSKVKAALDGFNEALLALAAPDGEGPLARPAKGYSLDPSQLLAQAFERAINCLRHHLAIDSLTTGMLDEMGIGSESVTLKSIRHGVNPLVPVGRAARDPAGV